MDYFDHAAATPLDERVLQAMQPYFSVQFYNPSASYGSARQVAADLQAARAKVAHWLGARPSEIVFTAGGTEANNLAISGIMQRYPQANLVVSAIEHDAVLQPAARYDHRLATVDISGTVDLENIRRAIDSQTVLVSIMYANNEIGTIQPLQDVAAIINSERQRRRQAGEQLPIYFHTDACQAGNYLDLHVSRLGVDLMTINGSKIYGPKQSGLLYIKSGIDIVPIVQGGGQERNLRSGTENVAACIGLAAALDIAQSDRQQEVRRLQTLQQHIVRQLQQTLPAAVVNGSQKKRLPNNIHVTFPGYDNERLLIQLEAKGILAAAGSACAASDQESSHVLRAIGLDDEQARASLRFTMGRATDMAAADRLLAALAELAPAAG